MYKSHAEWRDLNATRAIREFRNREGALFWGAYWLLLVANQDELLPLKGGRFCLRRDPVDYGDVRAAKAAFRE
jgi:hypothetical protein